MSDNRFDITFLRGPRDLSPWQIGSSAISRQTQSPQVEREALVARALFPVRTQELERFPNATFELKGWNR